MRSPTAITVGLAALASCAPVAHAEGAPPSSQELVTLLGKHKVLDRPASPQKPVASIAATRPITGVRTVLPVLGVSDEDGRSWLRVRLPGRERKGEDPPRSGWISAARTRRSTSPWHIVVKVRARRVLAYRGGERQRKYRAIVGKRSTPTPRGRYFVEENVKLPDKAAGAPLALATSARSKVLQEFEGGPGQIALHGIDNIGGKLGTAESHGCVRLATKDIKWLGARIEPGVPVTFRR